MSKKLKIAGYTINKNSPALKACKTIKDIQALNIFTSIEGKEKSEAEAELLEWVKSGDKEPEKAPEPAK